MRFDKFTIKSREALAEAQDRAERSNHPDVKPLHLLAALLEQEGGIVVPIVTKMGVSGPSIAGDVANALGKLPRVHGAQVSFSNDLLEVV